ncbi:similar to Saccharomyces cerevisiae YHR043C DOG2 deoxyglucose-6-phosphate phosphatase [Maudiozyma saulgeensis]|uniref:Similar to Saccharomyces cerevisiae YHR043C DOG2 deoxyglucose-6-phosphate phosphatase n=1 Tax=Maudiozyma saulgeensis TaxID=1789683 RepID=A0A1X7R194_9SACH|nr:similar to Saccharomyces cerevisiae YHR043C DOG2 deoxyglucose-6-phosphate phosphatase [Kazachstania saulgeensis]
MTISTPSSTHTIDTDVCLFDLDGTIVDTTIAAESTWRKLCKQYNVDPEELFKVSHGSKSAEMLARFFPDYDNTDNKGAMLLEKDMADNYLDTVKLVSGAKELLLALDRNPKDSAVNYKDQNKRRWAIVTSGSPYLAFSWFSNILKEVGKPDVFVTGNDVSEGKPHPMGYMRARDELSKTWNFDIPCRSVVFEDAPVGIKAGNSMGAITIGIASSYPPEKLAEIGANFVVKDLSQVSVVENPADGSIKLEIRNPLFTN